MPISEELKRIYASAPVDVYYIETLSLYHPIFENGVRHITNQNGGWVGDLAVGQAAFNYVPFVIVPPSAGDEGALSLKVGIDNAARSVMADLETLSETPSQPIEVIYRIYLSNDLTGAIQNDPPLKLWVSSVLATQEAVTFSATTTNLRDLPFPRVLYSIDNFPGLER